MPLTVRKFAHILNMGKTLSSRERLQCFQIAFILSDNKDKHKISVKFDFWLNRVVHSGVICP